MAVDIEAAQHYHRARTTERFQRREAERQQWLQRTRDAVALLAPRFPAIHQGRFRHLFCHAYGVELDPLRLQLVMAKATVKWTQGVAQ